MASIINGIVASVVCLIGIILGVVSEEASNLFWTFFSFSLVTLLISYIPLFPAFLKLRKIDQRKRAYKVPGGEGLLKLMTYVPLVLLILGVIFTLFIDFTYESIMANAPLILGVIVSFIIEEILVYQMSKKENN